MAPEQNDLSVRQFQRLRCDLPGSVVVDDQDAGVVKFAHSVTNSAGEITLRVTDCSRGGLGLVSLVYLPPGLHMRARVQVGANEMTFLVRVQRVRMTDRKPSYYVGTALVGSSQEQVGQIESLLAYCTSTEAPVRA